MRKLLKIVGIVIASLLLVVLLAIGYLLTPSGNKFLTGRIENYLRKKLKTEVKLERLGISFPKNIVLQGLLVPDLDKDTLLYASKLHVDMSMLALLENEVNVQNLHLENALVQLKRKTFDSTFNFQYIIDAFVPAENNQQENKANKNDSSAALVFSVNKIKLDHIRFKMDDRAGGMYVNTYLGKLRTGFDEIDIAQQIFKLKKLEVENLHLGMAQGKSFLPPSIDTTAASELIFGSEEIAIKDISYYYKDITSGMMIDAAVGKANIKALPISTKEQFIAIGDLLLDKARVNVEQHQYDPALVKVIDSAFAFEDTTEAQGWRIVASHAQLKTVDFIYNDTKVPHQKLGMDYSHLNFKNFNIELKDGLYTADTIIAQIVSGSVQEKSGFDLKQLRAQVLYHNQGGIIRNLFLQTDQSLLQYGLAVKYPSIEAVSRKPELMFVNTDIRQSKISVKDILIFAPQLIQQEIIRNHRNAIVSANMVGSGYLNDLNFSDFHFSGLGSTVISGSGHLKGLPKVDNLNYDFNLKNVSITGKDLAGFLPKSTLENIRLPDRISISGFLNGTKNVFRPNLKIVTSEGNADVKGMVSIAKGTENIAYDLQLQTKSLNVGRIIKQEKTMGEVSADLVVKGQGYDPKTMVADVKGNIQQAVYNGYSYNSIKLKANAQAGIIHTDIESDDPNAELDLVANINMTGPSPVISGKLMLDSIDFQRLNFTDVEFRIRGKIVSEFDDLNPDYPVGILNMDHPIVVYDGKRYVLDSLYLVSAPANGNQDIKLYADVIGAELTGRLPLTRAGDVIMRRIDKYYQLSTQGDTLLEARDKTNPLPEDYDLTLHAQVYDRPLLYAFMPGLTYFDSASVYASFTPYLMSVDAYTPRVHFGDNRVSDISIKATGAENALRYQADVAYINLPFMRLWDGMLKGEVKNSVVTTALSLSDQARKERFALGGMLYRGEGQQTFELAPDLKLDYENWAVNQPNRIVFGEAGYYVDNFGIGMGNANFSINSTPPQFNAPLHAALKDFQISTITNMLNSDTVLMGGTINGTVNIPSFTPAMNMIADLRIENFNLYEDTVGLLSIKAQTTDGNDFQTNVTITEQGNNVLLLGNYYLEPVNGNNFNLKLNLDPLTLKSIQGAGFGNIKNSSGNVTGSIDIKGTTNEPQLNGQLNTLNAVTTVTFLGSKYFLPKEQITFDGGTIGFNNFKIYDTLKHYLAVNGNVQTKDYSNYKLNLDARADKWMMMNSTPKDNKDFNGKVILSTKLNLQGTSDAPFIDGMLTIHDSTDLNITVPETQQQMESSEGIVKFVDFNDSLGHLLIPRLKDTIEKVKLGLGSTMNINVNIEPNAIFDVIVDPSSGDFLQVRGNGALNTMINPDGTIGLSGSYALEDGAYQFSYNLIKRKFKIQKGSSIQFNGGDATEALLDITAIYTADLAPYELVQDQVDQSQLVYYRQRLPFDVSLKLEGALMKPSLNFDIKMQPEGATMALANVSETVEAKLTSLRTDPSAINKQVFGVLLLNRFVGENPFDAGNNFDVEHVVRQSVSRFLTAQLNKYADQMIKGFEINIDLNSAEDYTSGEKRNRTDLSLAATKQLFNNRLAVTVGNNFIVEGAQANRSNSLVPGNIALNYSLTEDGRYAVRAYRTNKNVGVIEGYVVETGLKFTLNMSYDKFKEVFESAKKRKERLKAEQTPFNEMRGAPMKQ